jgi:hypothetical protein
MKCPAHYRGCYRLFSFAGKAARRKMSGSFWQPENIRVDNARYLCNTDYIFDIVTTRHAKMEQRLNALFSRLSAFSGEIHTASGHIIAAE